MIVCSPLKLLYHVKHVFDKMRGVSLRTKRIKSIFFDVNVPNLPTYVYFCHSYQAERIPTLFFICYVGLF